MISEVSSKQPYFYVQSSKNEVLCYYCSSASLAAIILQQNNVCNKFGAQTADLNHDIMLLFPPVSSQQFSCPKVSILVIHYT